ncbi:MAG: cell wall-associated NlpC family hydrolase [Cocleimonas sp.]|jgi:cell wall-associated NlpC family hydrolase
MKKTCILLLFIGLIQFLSGCSHGYHSNTFQIQQAQQQQRSNQIRQHAKVKAPSIRNASQTKSVRKSSYTSQQTQRNAVVTQHPGRSLMTKIAHSTIGNPYKWGGNNPQQGFDCSGLMSYVHRHALGIKIPRTAAQQRDNSRTISYAQLQPGDMLFFKTGKRSNHVGIYVGNRKFVHAATGSKEVKVASMDSSYWHKRFVKFGTFL